MPQKITRSYLQTRHWSATLAVLSVLAMTVFFGAMQLNSVKNNARYSAAFVEMTEKANGVKRALLHLTLDAADLSFGELEVEKSATAADDLRTSIRSLTEVYSALRMSDPNTVDNFDDREGLNHRLITPDSPLDLSLIQEKYGLDSRGMPEELIKIWAGGPVDESTTTDAKTAQRLGLHLAEFLRLATDVQAGSEKPSDLDIAAILAAMNYFGQNISPALGEITIAIRQSSDKSAGAALTVLAIGAAFCGLAALFNALFLFRPMVNSIEEHQAALVAERDRAVVSVQAKKEFLAVMSHELRTPMNGVLGFANLALRTDLTDTQRDYVETIKNSGESLLDLLNSILDLSKIEAGSLELEPHRFSIQETVDSAVQLMSAQAFEKRLDLTHFVDPELPSELHGDSGLIRKLVLNLVGNAIKFTEEGGVSIEVHPARGQEAANGGDLQHGVAIEVAVSDTGIGIREDKLELIFDRFSQADSSEKRLYEGTGLGLAICREISELMGGKIWVESKNGAGSTFRAILHLEQVEPQAPSLRDINGHCLRDLRVLVVDDNPINCRIASLQIQAHGARCDAALVYGEAIDALSRAVAQKDPYDICVIDQMMPKVDGPTLLKMIRADERFAGLRTILSSSAGVRTDAAAQELGFDAAAPKPVNQNQLIEAIARLRSHSEREHHEALLDERIHSSEEPRRTDAGDEDNGRLLVVEDNIANLKLATLILEAAGYTVDEAVNGVEAIAAVSRFDYDAVLMDIRMPVMDGLEATQRIKLLPGYRSTIPIIAMTADVAEFGENGLLDAGMVDLVSKPIDEQKLLSVLSNHIARRTDTAA